MNRLFEWLENDSGYDFDQMKHLLIFSDNGK